MEKAKKFFVLDVSLFIHIHPSSKVLSFVSKLMSCFFLVFFFLAVHAIGSPDYREQFYGQLNQGEFSKMEATLKNWESSCPDDVDMLEAYGGYYYNKAKKGTVANRGKLTAREDIALAGKAGKTDSRTRFDREGLLKAADYWKKVIRLYPWRLDTRFSLAHLYQDLDNFESQYQTLAETFQYVDKNRKKLRRENNGELPERPSKFIPESMQAYENYYFGQQRLESDEKAFRLAKLIITFYPNHPYAYNSMAAYYWFKNDWEHTLKYLIIANQKDPKDSLVLNNIGNTLVKLDKRKEAKIYYQKVVQLNRDEEYVENAEKRLKELDEN